MRVEKAYRAIVRDIARLYKLIDRKKAIEAKIVIEKRLLKLLCERYPEFSATFRSHLSALEVLI